MMARGACTVPQMSDPLVHAAGLTKRFDSFVAVDGVDFDVRPGEAFGFLGPNGAGKSSTMRMIGAVSPVTGGTLRVLGMDPEADGPAIRARLGVVPQENNLDTELPVEENLLVYGRYFGLSRPVIRERIEDLLDFAQLEDRRRAVVDHLSGGMKRRLIIARALINQPDLLILDEPTTGLDPQNRRALWSYLRNLHESGTTIFLTTQYLEEADELAERLAIIDNGKIVIEGTPENLKSDLGGDVVRVTLPEDVSRELIDRALGALQSLEGSGESKTYDHSVAAYVRDGSTQMASLVRRLDAEQIPVVKLEVAEPSLDDVFLRHTGERLRVDQVTAPSRMVLGRRGKRRG